MNARGTASGLVPVATGGSSSVQLDEYGDPYLVWSWDVSASLDRKFVYDFPLTGDGCAASDFGSAASHVKVGWNLLLELNALNSDAIIRRYTWGLDLSGQSGNAGTVGLHAAGGIGGLLGMNDVSASKNYVYFMDANGNVMQLLDSSNGSIAARYEFYSYGGELVATGSAATANPFRFSSQYWDTEAQVYYFSFRYLRPKMGRWLNRDPIAERGGSNLYAYLANAPPGRVDAMGLQECTPHVHPSVVIRRYPGLLAHEWIEVGGSPRGFSPDSDKPELFTAQGKWQDESTVPIFVEFTDPDNAGHKQQMQRYAYYIRTGQYYEWQTKTRCWGTLKHGSLGKNVPCKCASDDQITACISAFTQPGRRDYAYCVIFGNCRDNVERALSECCLRRDSKTHRPTGTGGGTGTTGSK